MLANGPLRAGLHRQLWTGRDESGVRVTSGVYFVRLVTPEGAASRKIVLLR